MKKIFIVLALLILSVFCISFCINRQKSHGNGCSVIVDSGCLSYGPVAPGTP